MPHIPILEHPPSRLQQRDGSGQRARTQEDRALLVINTRVCFPLLLQARLVPSLGEHRTTLRHVRVQDLAEVSRVVIQALDGGAVQCGRKLLLVLRLEFDDAGRRTDKQVRGSCVSEPIGARVNSEYDFRHKPTKLVYITTLWN